MITRGRFDVVMPQTISHEASMIGRHSIPVLEAHFGMPIISPPLLPVTKLSDKGIFAEWMISNNLTMFTPRNYPTKDAIKYPCLVKWARGVFGMGIFLANNEAELEIAIKKQPQGGWLYQEAIPGVYTVLTCKCIINTSAIVDECAQ